MGRLKSVQQPSRIDSDHHDEKRVGQEKVNCLKHLHDLVGRTAVEVVDVEEDSIDGAELVVGAGISEPRRQGLEILADRRD